MYDGYTCGLYGRVQWFLCAASTEQIDKAKEIIKKLTFNFQSEAFENPSE